MELNYFTIFCYVDNAGKTSILSRLRLQEFRPTVPTVGFTVETVISERVQFTVWDVGGQVSIKHRLKNSRSRDYKVRDVWNESNNILYTIAINKNLNAS